MDITSIPADQLLELITRADQSQCLDGDAAPLVTLLDFRNENFLSRDDPPPRIRTLCRTTFLQLDDIRDAKTRSMIPRHGRVVTITETGNRDGFVIRYLSTFGFRNISALEFGMRGWLKEGYPIEKPAGP